MATLLAETTDVESAIAEEQSLSPGLYEVRLYTISPITQGELNQLHKYFLERGVDVVGSIEQRVKGLWQLRIKYRKHPSVANIAVAQLLIPLIPTFLIAILVGIGIFKIGEISRSLMPIILAVGAFTVASLYIVRRPAER